MVRVGVVSFIRDILNNTEFSPVDFDKKRIGKMFEVFPRENVPITGGKGKRFQKKKPRK